MADVISRLKLESGEYDSKIKRATQGLLQMETECRKVGGTLAVLEKDQLEFVKSLGKMETVSTSVRGKLGELTQAYTELAVQYKRLTNEEKNSDFGRALNASLQQLKGRINETKNQLADVNKELNASGGKFGEFGNIIDTIGSKFGVSGNLTEMLTSKTAMLTGAVGAGIAIVSKATEAWAGYNAELAKQDQITTFTTGLKGDDANRMTDTMRALSDTYNVDFREAINAANTLMTQFGKTGDEAVQIIKDGMQGMIQGDGPKLLSMIQQYAPAFRDAGVSASQLVAVIQNSEGGIFTDQNMNAIVMGIKNIRLMTKATSDALAQLGIDGQKMSQQLSDGSLTIFDALKQVASAVQNVNSNSQAAGEVMQQVFGRQGAMAGTKLGEAIATLNTNLEQTKKQTGEVGNALADLQTANEKLNKAIRDCFEYDGWDQMAKGIQAKLVTALATVLDYIGKIKGSLTDFVGGAIKAGEAPKPEPKYKNGAYWERKDENGNVTSGRYWNNQQVSQQEYDKLKKDAETPIRIIKPTKGGNGGGRNTERNLDEEQKVQAKINALLKEALTADAQRLVDIRQQVADLQKQQEKYKDIKNIAQGILPKDKEAVFTIDGQLNEETKKALSDIKGVTIDDKSLTITANTSDALKALQGIEGVTIDPKTVTITATDEAMPKLREIDGITIDDKTMTVTADTQEAMQKVQELIGVVSETKLMPIKPVITDDDIDNLLRKQYGQAIEVPVVPKMSAGDELVQSIRLDLAQSIQETDMQTLRTLLEAQIKNGIEGVEIPANSIIDHIFGEESVNIPDEYWRNLQEQINEKLREMNIEELNIDFGTGKDNGKDKKESDKKESKEEKKYLSEGLSQLSGGLNGLQSGFSQLGIDLGDGFGSVVQGLSGISSILMAIQTIVGAIEAISAIDSIIPFAGGGIVKAAGGTLVGNSYSGDNLRGIDPSGQIYGLNAGEVVLNKSQVGNLASQLSGSGMQNLHLETYLDGRAIRIVLNNESQGRLKGKYVTSRRG